MSYHGFAEFYDGLQSDVNYPERAEYILELFKRYDRLPTLLLDMACGTGGFSLEFLERGIDVIGVDPSFEMLNVARNKLASKGYDVLLLCQTAEELDLYGTVDGAVCCLDSLNHITDESELMRSIDKISLFLEQDRLFIFDVNTEYKHKNILSGATFTAENDEVFCVWTNSECDADGVVDITLDFFGKNDDGTYFRKTDEFSERAYSEKFLDSCIERAGLRKVVVLKDMGFSAPEFDEQRVIYVTRKVK